MGIIMLLQLLGRNCPTPPVRVLKQKRKVGKETRKVIKIKEMEKNRRDVKKALGDEKARQNRERFQDPISDDYDAPRPPPPEKLVGWHTIGGKPIRKNQKVKAKRSSGVFTVNYKTGWVGVVTGCNPQKKKYFVKWETDANGKRLPRKFRRVTLMSFKNMDKNFWEERRRLSQRFPPPNAAQDRLAEDLP